MTDSFGARKPLKVGAKTYQIYRLDAVSGPVDTLPYSLKILLENLLRYEDGANVTAEDIDALANWDPQGRARPRDRVHAGARAPARFHRRARASSTSRRCATRSCKLGGDAEKINPLEPAELVIDHSVQVDEFGTARRRSRRTTRSSSSATRSATRSCAGARARSRTSASCRRTRASCTRSTSSTSAASSSSGRTARIRSRIPTRSSAPIRTRR